MRIEMHHVGAEIARPRNAENGVHVRAVEINQAAALMHQTSYLRHLLIEQSERAGISDHEHGNLVVELRRQVLHIDHALAVALHGHEIETGHAGAGRIGAVGAIGRENFCAVLLMVAKVRGGDQ